MGKLTLDKLPEISSEHLTASYVKRCKALLVKEIFDLLPDKQEYVDFHLCYSAGVKYAGKKDIAGVSFYAARREQYDASATGWEYMPIEDLLAFRDQLALRKAYQLTKGKK
jgi:hypothetical protein